MNFKNLTKGIMASLIGVVMLASCGGDNPPVNPPAVNLGNGVALVGNCVKSDMSAAVLSWTSGQPVTYSAVTKLTATKIGANGNKHIVGVRAYIPNDGSGLTVFAGSDYQNPEVTKSAEWQAAGWQYVMFDTPLEIKGSDYYIGFTVSSTSLALETTRSTSNDLIQVDGKWMSLKDMVGANAFWAVQAIVAGGDYSKKTQVDVTVDLLSLEKPWGIKGETTEGYAEIRNNGVKTIKNLTVNVELGSQSSPVTIADSLMNGQSYRVKFAITGPNSGEYEIKVTANPEGDKNANNGIKTDIVRIYDDASITRNRILVEQVTGTWCPNCPGGTAAMKEAIAGLSDPNKVAWIAYHDDKEFGMTDANKLISSYAEGITGIPTATINRSPMNVAGEYGMFWHPGYATTALLEPLTTEPTFASMKAEKTYDATSREITLKVSGESKLKNIYVTAIVLQDGTVYEQSQGGSNYVHNNVPWTFLTEATGNAIEVKEDGTYSIELKGTVAEKLNAFESVYEKMNVVVFVHGDMTKGETVYNADLLKLTDETPASIIDQLYVSPLNNIDYPELMIMNGMSEI